MFFVLLLNFYYICQFICMPEKKKKQQHMMSSPANEPVSILEPRYCGFGLLVSRSSFMQRDAALPCLPSGTRARPGCCGVADGGCTLAAGVLDRSRGARESSPLLPQDEGLPRRLVSALKWIQRSVPFTPC